MKVSEIVRFGKERCFNGAVQTEWFYDSERVDLVAKSYMFHGPKYFGVSEADINLSRHKLIDTASFALNIAQKLVSKRPDNCFSMTIAGYGAGKSHLVVSLASLFAQTGDLSNEIIDNIEIADRMIAESIRELHKKKNLVIVLNGMNNFNLDAEVLKCVRLALEQNDISDDVLRDLTKSYDIARHFVERTFAIAQQKFENEADSQGLSLKGDNLKGYLLSNVESDAKVLRCINNVYVDFNGDSIRWDRGLAAGDILAELAVLLCGENKPFNKILFLFDEFGRFVEYVAANPEIAGEAALQQIFEAVQNANGTIIFTGFMQSELDTYLKRIEKTANIGRYIGRYKSSENLFLSSNFETILANVLQKIDEKKHETAIGSAISRYKDYHNKMENALNRWDKTLNKKSVWTDSGIYNTVILRGCYPLHPCTVWLLSNMNDWMQQRSAIAFTAEMVEKISGAEIENGWLPYVYPVNIIDSSIYDEMLNAEEGGRVQSQYCMLYRDITFKIGDKLSTNEMLVLRAVLITNIARFSFYNKADALLAIRYCSNLREEEIITALKSLENLHGVVAFDDNTKTFDLIAEANGFNEFKRVYSRYRIMTKNASIDDLDEALRKELSLLADIETAFGQEHHISSLEWKFKKTLLDSKGITKEQIAIKIRVLEGNISGEEYRGELIFAYCAENAEVEVARISAIHQEMQLANATIIIVFLDDCEGEILTALTAKNVLNRFSSGDHERFEKHISGQHKAQDKKIVRKFNALVQDRQIISDDELIPYQGRLNHLCTERFGAIFTKAVPFMFDGFENKTPTAARRYLANICTKMYDRTLLNIQSYNALTSDEKNRVKATLAVGVNTSWQVYNNSCMFVKPVNALALEIFNELEGNLKNATEALALMQLFGRYTKKPYSMNSNALALFVFYYIAYEDKNVLCYYGKDKLQPSHVSEKIFKKQKLDPRELIKIRLQKNENANRDILQELCKEIMSCTIVEQCQQYKKKLDDMTAQEGITADNQLVVAAASARLDEGISLRNSIYEKIDKANDLISEAKSSFSIQKFYRVFNYYVDTSAPVSPQLPFEYSDHYKKQMDDLKANVDIILRKNALKGIGLISCNITQLSQFKGITANIAKALREHDYEDYAKAIELRYQTVDEDLLARQKYEAMLVELDKDIAMAADVNSLGYSSCVTYMEKMQGWDRFFDATKDMPDSLMKAIKDKISKAMDMLSKRIGELSDVCRNTIAQVEANESIEMVENLKEKLIVLSDIGLQENDVIRIASVLKEIGAAQKEIENIPGTLDALKDYINFIPKEKYGSCLVLVDAEVRRRISQLQAQQARWVERFIISTEENISSMTDYECTNWLNCTAELPQYLDNETIKRYKELVIQVEARMHKSRVDGVLQMYSKLTDQEKLEVQRAITQGTY